MCLHCLGIAFVKSFVIATPIWIVYIGIKIKFLEWRDKRKMWREGA